VALQQLSSHNAWVPGHSGIYGNEAASFKSYIGPEPVLPVSTSVVQSQLQAWTLRETQTRWQDLNCLNRHLSVLGLINNSPKCDNCNEADETALHYLCYCNHYGAVRTRIWGKPFLHPSKVPHITVKDLLRFLTSSRRFSSYPGKEYQGLYCRMDYGPICGLVLRRSTFAFTETSSLTNAAKENSFHDTEHTYKTTVHERIEPVLLPPW